MRVQRRAWRLLDDATEVHHGDPVADVLDDAQVVRDEEVREAHLRLQVGHEVQDLRLDRQVERGYRLVGDDEARADRERTRDADTLTLAAAELVRVAVVVLRTEPDLLQQRFDPTTLLGALREAVNLDAPRRRSRRRASAGSATRRDPER